MRNVNMVVDDNKGSSIPNVNTVADVNQTNSMVNAKTVADGNESNSKYAWRVSTRLLMTTRATS